jgi:hypothetical protein
VSGFPAAGTFNSWLYDVTYPIANGGASVNADGQYFPSQFCDVQVENDGSGGTYTDWTTATSIQYFAYGVIFLSNGPYVWDITIDSIDYPNGTYLDIYKHNGTGGYVYAETPTYAVVDTLLGSETINSTVSVSTNCSSSVSLVLGTFDRSYYSDGVGGYYSINGSPNYSSYGTLVFDESCYDSTSESYTSYFYNSDGNGSYYVTN